MERQAGYVSGALVDAPEPGQTLSRCFPPEYAVRFPLQAGIHRRADSIIGRVSEVFDVSREAAEVRLLAARPFDSPEQRGWCERDA
jgi:hypothetical protein